MIKATLMDYMGSDITVVNAARVSFGKKSSNTYTTDKDDKLIRYLAEHRHMSPFGHCFASFHVRCPLFVHAQLLKHKFLRANTISRRYVDEDPEFFMPKVWRGRSANKKQGSEGEVKTNANVEHFYDTAFKIYKQMLDEGVAPEQARMILPQATMTEFIWSGSLDAFADMCNLRCASDTQAETRFVATQISDRMRRLFPVSWAALMEGLTEYKFG